ncbi:MAG: cytochrome c, partial [Nitrospinota bacterium]|nr:cytochrome c [Nitrospinota bacterium]
MRFIVCFSLALTTLSLALPGVARAKAGDILGGKEVYLARCFQCHGLSGDGNGPAAAYLPRNPRDFTSGQYKLKTSPPTTLMARDQDIYDAIANGLLPNGMPTWKDTLSEKEIWDLVAYLKSLSDLYEGESDPPALEAPKTSRTAETQRWGRKAYFELKCDECHGEDGAGNPDKILKDDYGRPIKPRDL